MIGNISAEAFIVGWENSCNRLPFFIKTWESLDWDLQEEYISQFHWMVEIIKELYSSLEVSNQIRIKSSLQKLIQSHELIEWKDIKIECEELWNLLSQK